MAGANLDIRYLYAYPSQLEVVDSKPTLRLATAGGTEVFPYFFSGQMLYPRRTADMLLTCSLISRTRFYHPGELTERLLLAADPVVTSGGERLRFESFSVCCGVYCRVDLNPRAIDGDWQGTGTTNVDFNPPMRQALSSILGSDSVGLNVGESGLVVEKGSEQAVEKKVKLPVRWLKGFVEVQSYQKTMKPAFDVPVNELRQLLRNVSANQTWQKGSVSYLVPAGKGIRLSQRETANAVCVGTPGRLKILEDLLQHASQAKFYGSSDGVMAVELEAPEASFHIVMSPRADRGFSGEGQALVNLADTKAQDKVNQLRAELKWQAKIDPTVLATKLNMTVADVESGLAVLGSRGLVGFDLSEGKYFHRELPFDLSLTEELQPRLIKARGLVEENKVRITSKNNNVVEAYVQGDGAEHRVVIDENQSRCTCPWYAKHPGERGPCSHILAVDIKAGQD